MDIESIGRELSISIKHTRRKDVIRYNKEYIWVYFLWESILSCGEYFQYSYVKD